jgi:hypothetical protein
MKCYVVETEKKLNIVSVNRANEIKQKGEEIRPKVEGEKRKLR